MTDYQTGLWHGICLLTLVYFGASITTIVLRLLRERSGKRLLKACGNNQLLMDTLLNASGRSDEERTLWRRIAAIGPYTVSLSRPGENPSLSRDVLYGAIAMKGLEYLVHSSNIDPAVLDGLIQSALEGALHRVSSAKGDDE